MKDQNIHMLIIYKTFIYLGIIVVRTNLGYARKYGCAMIYCLWNLTEGIFLSYLCMVSISMHEISEGQYFHNSK